MPEFSHTGKKIYDFLDIAKQTTSYSSHKFYLAGAGPLKDRLLERIRKEKIPLTYLGYIPRQKIFSVLSTMQIGIAPSTRDLARVVASPIKIFDYMASGLPVITPKIGDWGEIIAEEDCGIALEDDSTESYKEALNTLAQKDVWTIKSNNAINAIKRKYNWDDVLKPLVDLISNYQ
jgi:glycosyltransferase involved in cell wall biosynthesis